MSPLETLERLIKDPGLAYYPRVIQLLEHSDEKYWNGADDDSRDPETPFREPEKEKEIVEEKKDTILDFIVRMSAFLRYFSFSPHWGDLEYGS
jgi:hypothetical protein